ncbi:MAG: hypothetical protein ABW223_08570 [Rariglobus sp.]
MLPRFPRLWFLGFGLLASAASAAVSLDGLAKDSPFMLKRDEAAAPVVTENATVEFRGMISTKDGVLFGLYDRTRNTSAWVKQDDKGADFVVRAFDAAGDMVTVDYQGQKLTLPLSAAKIGAAAPSPVPVVNAPVNNGGAQPAVARVNDQQRLESVAAEVRRRRALRQAAASGGAAAPAATNTTRQ